MEEAEDDFDESASIADSESSNDGSIQLNKSTSSEYYKILGKECELLIFFSEVQLVAALPLVPSKLWLDG